MLEGRVERDREIAENCIIAGMTNDNISSITGLSISKIEIIRKTIDKEK